MRLLAAVDFGATHGSVVATAKALGEALGLEPLLLHVVPDPYFQGLARHFPELKKPLQEVLAQVEARVEEALRATGLKAWVLRGLPAFVVGGEAHRAKLVILGQVGEAPLERLARGGIARYLLHRGEAPVLLVPAEKPLTQVRRIGVGVDESDAALAAFRLAEAWGKRLGAEVQAFHLVSGEGGCCYPTYLDPKNLSLAQVLAQAEAHLSGRYPGVQVFKGENPEDLLEVAQRVQVDLLVLGSKAKSTWRHRLGQMVEGALKHAELPLLIVPEATVW
ncbi:universal stress protein [Thermus composti]|uniref:Universal stress protein n=1 Tax=Thermus composti TaxID=532059 RepID=A0ABV6Q1P5_9DEIN|nr:universal stress protein [Thermus composti]GGN01463.1 universal stress protein [Thermus composti]